MQGDVATFVICWFLWVVMFVIQASDWVDTTDWDNFMAWVTNAFGYGYLIVFWSCGKYSFGWVVVMGIVFGCTEATMFVVEVMKGIEVSEFSNVLFLALVLTCLIYEIFNLVLLKLIPKKLSEMVVFMGGTYTVNHGKMKHKVTYTVKNNIFEVTGSDIITPISPIIYVLEKAGSKFIHFLNGKSNDGGNIQFDINKEFYVCDTEGEVYDEIQKILHFKECEPIWKNSLDLKFNLFERNISTIFVMIGALFYIVEIAFVILKGSIEHTKLLNVDISQFAFSFGFSCLLWIIYQPQKKWNKIWDGKQHKVNFIMNLIFLVLLLTIDMVRVSRNNKVSFLQFGINLTCYCFILSYWELSKFVSGKEIFLLSILHLFFHIVTFAHNMNQQTSDTLLDLNYIYLLIENNYLFSLLILVFHSLKEKFLYVLWKRDLAAKQEDNINLPKEEEHTSLLINEKLELSQ